MPKPCEPEHHYRLTRQRIIGLGERTVRKSYYPQLQRRLEELERFRFLLDQASDMIFLFDADDGRIRDGNRSAVAISGYPFETLITLPVTEIFPQKGLFADFPFQSDRLSGEADSTASSVTFCHDRSGQKTMVEISVEKARLKNTTLGLIVARDIGARLRAEEDLKRSELRYRALFEDSPISLWEENFSKLKRHLDHLKGHGVQNFTHYFSDHPEEITRCIRLIRIVDVNRATLALYEAASKEELLGNIHRILPQTAHNVLKQELVAMAQEGRFEIECVNRTLKGNDRHLLIKSSIPPGYEGSWEKVFISVYDLTERIEAEEEKKTLGRQLRQAQKMEAVGTLAGGIAHDFNNILSAVIGFTEMAMEDAPPDSFLSHNMEQVLQAGLRAKHLVQQILAFSRQSEHEMRPVQLDRIIHEACELLRASLPTTIDIHTDIQTDAFTMGDPTQMHQVLMNLCTNAGHAMRDRGGRLSITMREAAEDEIREKRLPGMTADAYLLLQVEDTGHGIPPNIIERIFDPFFTTKEHTEGTGMGLSVAHGIIKSHGGSIDVESQPGRGTIFRIYLPQIQRHAKDDHRDTPPLPSGTERVLFVDDETMLVDMSRQILQRLGYQVTACTSSVEALQHFQNDPTAFDLVITDMTMPHMTGKELAVALLKINPELPIILCTGFSETITEDAAKRIGIQAFILKPIVMSDLAQTMRKVLDSTS
jgi:PAS domain S-box-containing protein